MSEQDAFETLVEYSKKLGIAYETHESQDRFYLFPNDPFLRTRYIVFKIDKLFFCAYDSYAAKAYTSNTYSGIYGLINLPADFECRIYMKDQMDLFLRTNKKKTGNKIVDDILTVTSKSKGLPQGLLSEKDALLFHTINSVITPIELLIQNDHRPIIRELGDKKIIGLETDHWIYKKEELDVFINTGSALIKSITESCA